MDVVGWVIGALGLIGCGVGVALNVRQLKENARIDRYFCHRHVYLAKYAQAVVGVFEALGRSIAKGDDAEIKALYSRGLSQSHTAMRYATENLFLQRTPLSENQIAHMRETGMLSGALEKVFDELRIDPPKPGSQPEDQPHGQ